MLRTCAIVTTAANEFMAPIHERIPVDARPRGLGRLAGPGRGPAGALRFFARPPSDGLEAYPVSSLVNNVRNDGARTARPASPVAGQILTARQAATVSGRPNTSRPASSGDWRFHSHR